MTTSEIPLMLAIEDSDEDYEAILWAMRKIEREIVLKRFEGSDEALEYLRGCAVLPSLILLDLNLNGTDGHETLTTIKRDEKLCIIPVIVLTTSTDPKDLAFCYHSGASGYINKPVDFEKFSRALRILTDYWFEAVMLP